MSIAVQSALRLSEQVFIWLDFKINEYFEQIYNTQDNSELTSYKLAINCAEEFNLKHTECIGLISLLLRNKEDLRTKSNSAGTIILNTEMIKSEPKKPKDSALRYYDKVCEIAHTLLEEQFLTVREKPNNQILHSAKPIIKVENICDQISATLNIKPYASYYCFKQYIDQKRPELFIKRGSNGGVAFKKDFNLETSQQNAN